MYAVGGPTKTTAGGCEETGRPHPLDALTRGDGPEPPRKPMVAAALDALVHQVDTLAEEVDGLLVRLAPALRNDPSGTDKPNDPTTLPYACALAAAVDAVRERVASETERLARARRLLEI